MPVDLLKKAVLGFDLRNALQLLLQFERFQFAEQSLVLLTVDALPLEVVESALLLWPLELLKHSLQQVACPQFWPVLVSLFLFVYLFRAVYLDLWETLLLQLSVDFLLFLRFWDFCNSGPFTVSHHIFALSLAGSLKSEENRASFAGSLRLIEAFVVIERVSRGMNTLFGLLSLHIDKMPDTQSV